MIVFNLKNKKNETKAWTLDLKNNGSLTSSKPEDFDTADLVITLKDLDFKKLVAGKSNSQKLFLGGKLKVKGDVMKAANIESILKSVAPVPSKLWIYMHLNEFEWIMISGWAEAIIVSNSDELVEEILCFMLFIIVLWIYGYTF